MWAFKTLIGLRICAALWLNITDTQHDRHWPEDSVLAAPWEAVHREAVPREAVGPAAAEPLPPVRFLQVCIGFAAFFQTYMIHALLHFSILDFP